MSFSNETKLEILSQADELDGEALLKGIVRGNLSLTKENGVTGCQISTDLSELALFTLRFLLGTGAEISPEQKQGLVNKRVYNVTLKGDGAKKLLVRVGILNGEGEYVGDGIPELDDDGIRGYVTGVFLSAGEVFIPKADSTGYQLEFTFASYRYAKEFAKLLEGLGFSGKIVERHDNYVLYYKESETISDIIAYTGASESVLRIQSLKVIRAVRNKENRISNCEVGNIGKVILAAQRQISAISELQQSGRLDTLDEKLKEVALLRLQKPEEKLDELAKLLGISKSCINHRLRKIESIARGEI